MWQHSYDAVIIDEFQDVNLAQSELLDLLTKPHDNYMAIGDDDQTIYGFRGASMGFFRDFGRRYNATIYEMTDNFRCQSSQFVLANRVIMQNKLRHPKTLVVTQGFGGRNRSPTRCGYSSVAQAVGVPGAGIAILVRITAQTPPIEQALIATGIPLPHRGREALLPPP